MLYLGHGYGGDHDKGVMAPMNSMNREPLAAARGCGNVGPRPVGMRSKGIAMAWTTPVLVEICIGLEINGYLPAEF